MKILPHKIHHWTGKPLDLEGQANEDVGEGLSRGLPKMSQSAPRMMTVSVKKKRRVIVVCDSLLRGTEGPICQPDPFHREVCCLPRAQVRDVAKKLSGLVQLSDYYPLLVMKVDSDEVVERSPKVIKKYFRALGKLVEGSEDRWFFPQSCQWQGRIPKGTGKLT